MSRWKTKHLSWIKERDCIGCGIGKMEMIQADNGAPILVNVESKGRVHIPEMWMVSETCSNPLCQWSKIAPEINNYNLTSTREAWARQV